MDGYGNMEMNLVVRPDKVDGIRTLFASMVMKKAAGIAEDWEMILLRLFRIDKEKYTIINERLWYGMKAPMCSVFYTAGLVFIGNNPEEWLFHMSHYFEDGILKINTIEYNGNPITSTESGVKCTVYVIKDGRLYDTTEKRVLQDMANRHTWPEIAKRRTWPEIVRNGYKIGRRIIFYRNEDGNVLHEGLSLQDTNYGEWFSCGEDT